MYAHRYILSGHRAQSAAGAPEAFAQAVKDVDRC